MKIKKLFNKLRKNSGSGIVLVIVALGFIGILAGALLTAVSYVYRAKLYDYNARDNFYYVEQAMSEIYAGLGGRTVACLQDAYTETVEGMTYYDVDKKTYRTKDSEEARKEFDKKFMGKVYDEFYGAGSDMSLFVKQIDYYISNRTVKLRDYEYNDTDGSNDAALTTDKDSLKMDGSDKVILNSGAPGITVLLFDAAGNVLTGAAGDREKLDKIVIKNVALTRTAEYDRSQANGSFTQTLSTDIVISRPDFAVNFNFTTPIFDNILDYAFVADMGVDIAPSAQDLIINGNVYAGADFYNKTYNASADSVHKTYKVDAINPSTITVSGQSDTTKSVERNTDGDVIAYNYVLNPVANAAVSDPLKTNPNAMTKTNNDASLSRYDGVNDNSKYSGFYIDGRSVSIIADTVVVPGTIAVMDNASLNVYNAEANRIGQAEVWADNIVLGGLSYVASNATVKGPEAIFNANVYVKDDLTLDASNSNFKLVGSYYGYSDSTNKDNRVFTSAVNQDNFRLDRTVDSTTPIREHYNSSAIIINGKDSNLDISNAETIFLAGRSYIELSKSKTTSKVEDNEITRYAYNDEIDDYGMGDAISVKSNQLAYRFKYPDTSSNGEFIDKTKAGNSGIPHSYYKFRLNNYYTYENCLFADYFGYNTGSDGKGYIDIPCTARDISGQRYYYYDFEIAYYNMCQKLGVSANAGFTITRSFDRTSSSATTHTIKRWQDMAAAFIEDYVETYKYDPHYSTDYSKLEPLDDKDTFSLGTVLLPTDTDSLYSNGAVTAVKDLEFTITSSRSADTRKINQLLESTSHLGATNDSINNYIAGFEYSDNIEKKYNYVKFSLSEDGKIVGENQVVDRIVSYHNDTNGFDNIDGYNAAGAELHGESAITPINTYLNYDKIAAGTTIISSIFASKPAYPVSAGRSTVNIGSDNGLIITSGDATVYPTNDSTHAFNGVVVAKGDVYIDQSVTSIQGMIVCGGKVIIGTNSALKTVSASPEVCRAVFNALQLVTADSEKSTATRALSTFKSYEDIAPNVGSTVDTTVRNIETLDYQSILKYDNWVKNVE